MIGQSIGRYHITEQLGQGGMATVYKAFDTRLECDVAVKFIRKEKLTAENAEKAIKRFTIEAKKTAQLSHPNIVAITDYGEHDSTPYLVMKFIAGNTLKQKLGQPIHWVEAARLLLPIARALEYAHQHKVVHRDVKPANILLTEDGEPMLSDFGIAKVLETDETGTLTGTGVGIGTPEYMAPEQGTGRGVDHRADIYALGVVFYELVTGRKPYVADTPMAVVIMHARDPLPSPRQFVKDLPAAVEKIIFKTTAKNPADRYQSMAEFVQALKRLTQVSDAASSVKSSKQVWVMGAVAALAVIALIAGGLWWSQSQQNGSAASTTVVQVLPTSTGTPTLAAQQFYVPGNVEGGMKFVAKTDGVYRFTYVSDAISGVSDPNSGTWNVRLYIYRNRDIVWNTQQDSKGNYRPLDPEAILGSGRPMDTVASAEAVDKGAFKEFPLRQNEFLWFIYPDVRNFFSDNRGGIMLSVTIVDALP
jgi:serine/threonine protein kinase